MRAKIWFLSTAAILPASLIAQPVAAQSVTLDPPPVRAPLDESGVDLSTGAIATPSSSLAIGGGDGLTHSRYRVSNGWRHNYIISITEGIIQGFNDPTREVNIGGSQREFYHINGTGYVPLHGEKGTLTEDTNSYTYTSASGVVYTFSKSLVANDESYYEAVEAVGTAIVNPNGSRTELTYRGDDYTLGSATIHVIRLQSVTNNSGYQLKYSYGVNSPTSANVDDWYDISKVTAINNAEEYCNPASDSCSLTGDWPYLSYTDTASGSDTLETVTDILGREARFRTDASSRLTGVKRPSETSDGMVVAYDTNSRVSSVTWQGSYTRDYTWSNDANGDLVSVSDDALGRERTVVTDSDDNVILSDTDALGNTVAYTYDSDSRVTDVIAPEGNKVEYTRDARGRVTEVRRIAKPGSTMADIVTSATYPALTGTAVCANAVTCDSPVTTTDARGNVTDYVYNAVHGGVTSVTLPADDNGDRPATTFAYAAQNARYRNSSGNLVTSPTAITKPTSVKRCRVSASCAGTANEQVIEITYDNTLAENLQPVSVTRKAGDGTLAATTAFTYSELGNTLTVDGPLAGSYDTTRTRYDLAGQVEGVIGPDPDGTSTLPRLAQRVTRNLDGQVTITEGGTVVGLTDPNWTAFSVTQKSVTTYDDFGRTETSAQVAPTGTTQFSVTQYSYDAAGRIDCVAQRMNAPTTATVLPADACTAMTAGTFGEDRISQRYYDIADRSTESWSAVGTALAQRSGMVAYTQNGQVDYIEDAAQNRTDYEYDGFDRSVKITYPDPATPSTVNASDYEAITYDAAGNILTHRSRANETFNFAYDDLGRLTSKIVPERTGLASIHTLDIDYSYDLFGALTAAQYVDASNNLTGDELTFAYDAIGRLTSATTDMAGTARTMSYQYDVANRRTRLTYPDAGYFSYEWDNMGRMTRIMDSHPTMRVQNVFNPDGTLQRRNRDYYAPDDIYHYDAALRLERIETDHFTAAYDVNRTYSFNPASQVVEEGLDNEDYAWEGHVNTAVSYTANGLNQYTAVAANTYTYDTNGNLTGDGSTTFTYDTENRLISASGQNDVDLRYDPFGRLFEIKDVSGNIERLLYDGDALVAEYNASGAMLDRYVHGPGAGDDPLIWHTGPTTYRWTANYLYADRQGSIVEAANFYGNPTAINSYDEYGVPGPSTGIENLGRFRYTGQTWIPELGQYYYKARMYSPGLGRFMQTDPIGYADGMNMYRYVGNDPVNFIDPTGQKSIKCSNGDKVDVPEDATDEQIKKACSDLGTGGILVTASQGGGAGAAAFLGGGGSGVGIDLNLVMCAAGLALADKDAAGLQRATDAWAILEKASEKHGIQTSLLAAIGVRETNFQNITEIGGGAGWGVFQLTNQPGVTRAQAFDLSTSADYAAGLLASNSETIYKNHPNFTGGIFTIAVAASFNLGPNGFSGNPDTIDDGSQPNGDYGRTTALLMSCFN